MERNHRHFIRARPRPRPSSPRLVPSVSSLTGAPSVSPPHRGPKVLGLGNRRTGEDAAGVESSFSRWSFGTCRKRGSGWGPDPEGRPRLYGNVGCTRDAGRSGRSPQSAPQLISSVVLSGRPSGLLYRRALYFLLWGLVGAHLGPYAAEGREDPRRGPLTPPPASLSLATAPRGLWGAPGPRPSLPAAPRSPG